MSVHPYHLLGVLVMIVGACPVIRAQEQLEGKRAVIIEAVDPDPSMLLTGTPAVPEDMPAMSAARPDTIITRDPEPHELVAGPRRQDIVPGPSSPTPAKITDP